MSSLKTTPVKVTPLKAKGALSNLSSLSKTIEKAQKNIMKNQTTPHSSVENLQPIGTPLSHFKAKTVGKRFCVEVNKTPLMSHNKINKSPPSKTTSRTATPKSLHTSRSATPKPTGLSGSSSSKTTFKTTAKRLKTAQKSPSSKYATPIKNETNILFQFSKDIFTSPDEESNPSFNEGFVELGSAVERMNRSHSASSIFRLRGKGDEGTPMSKIKRSLSEAKLSIQSSYSEYEGEKSQITVGVRVRPLLPREGMNGVNVSDGSVVVASDLGSEFTFSYEHCFSPLATQIEVYEALVRPLLDNALQGYNACLFAYGQTGSGKTFSMMGPNLEDDNAELSTESGMIPRFCKELLQKTATLEEACPSLTTSVEVSYLEVYNEKIHDLLVPGNTQLRVREHPVHGPYVVDLSRHTINSYHDFQHWINIGNKKRSTAMTEMNDKSSRSHSLFTVLLTQTSAQVRSDGTWSHDQTRRSQINLVDLAGSERIASTNVSSDRLREGASINRSLLTLGKVMSALVDNRGFVPYRESVLTWLLKESLGGNSRTCMLATVSPCSSHMDETMSTLRYASQARAIVNRVRVNEAPQDKEMRELREELERLRPAGERINNLLGEKEELEDQLNSKVEEVNILREVIEKYKSEVAELVEGKEQFMGDMSRQNFTEHELKFEKEHILQLEKELNVSKKELSKVKEHVKSLEKESEKFKKKELHDKETINGLQKNVEALRAEVSLAKTEFCDVLKIKDAIEKKLLDKSSKEHEFALHEKRIHSLKEELGNLKKEYEKIEFILKETKQNEEDLKKRLIESSLREERLAQNVEQIPGLETALNDLEKELRKARSELADSKKSKEELTKELHNACHKDEVAQLIQKYKEQLRSLDGELQKSKNELFETNNLNTELRKKLAEISSREELLKMEADKVSNLESELRLLEAETRICKRDLAACQLEKDTLIKELRELRANRDEFNKFQAKEAIQAAELKKILEELCQTKMELNSLEKTIQVLGKNLAESRSKEEQLLLKLQNSLSMESEFKNLKEELIAYKKVSENQSESSLTQEKLKSKMEHICRIELELSKIKGQLSAELIAKEELKKKLTDALTVGERLKFKADQAIKLEIELEKYKSELNEEKKTISVLSVKLSEYESKEEMLKGELHAKTHYLENAQAQIERQQQVQVTLMEEKLTLLKVMEKHCTDKELKGAFLEENINLKKEMATLKERLSNTSKENGELKKKLIDTENLLKTVVTNEGKREQALTAALENKDKEMYEYVMDSAFPHHLVYLVRKARTFTELYKIPYEFELGEKTVTVRHLMLSAKTVMNHLKLVKWIERIESEKTWFKSMDRDLAWEVDFGDYYEKNDAHKIIIEDLKDKNYAINIGTQVTASGCINPILWRKTMVKRHVMGIREDSDVLIKYFNEVEDSRVYSILTRIQVSVTRLQEATHGVEK